MSVGLALLRALLVDDKAAGHFLKDKIRPELFVTKEETKLFKQISEYLDQYGHLPNLETAQVETGIRLPEFPANPITYWMTQVRNRWAERFIHGEITKISTSLHDGKVDKAESIISHLHSQLVVNAPDMDLTSLASMRGPTMDSFRDRKSKGQNAGVPFGFESLDAISDGAKEGNTYALVGRRGVGKTWMLLRMVMEAFRAGFSIMIVTFEMSAEELSRRLLALIAAVSYDGIRLGNLDEPAKEIFFNCLADDHGIKKDRDGNVERGANWSVPVHIMKGSFASTAQQIRVWASYLSVDVVYVDGAYLLRTGSRYENRFDRISITAEELKAISQELGIPIISTYQYNRKGEVYGSDVVEQLASIVLGIGKDDEAQKDIPLGAWSSKHTRKVSIEKGREGEDRLDHFFVQFDHSYTDIREVKL